MARVLVAKLAEYAGRDVEIVVVPITSTNRLDKVASGEAMIEMGASTHNAARDIRVDFSLPYFLSGTTFIVRVGSALSSLVDLAGKVVSATAGTANLTALEAAVADGRLAGSTVKVSNSHEQGMSWLRDGTVDAYFTDTVLLLSLRATSPDPENLVIVQEPIQSEPYGWILPESDSDWRDFVATSSTTSSSGRSRPRARRKAQFWTRLPFSTRPRERRRACSTRSTTSGLGRGRRRWSSARPSSTRSSKPCDGRASATSGQGLSGTERWLSHPRERGRPR
jgi:hypothetical protein